MKHNKGHWLVTPPRGAIRRFYDTEKMAAFVKKRPSCLVSWVVPQ